jgi:HAD superfamily hydrolase (TIGR01490 family)
MTIDPVRAAFFDVDETLITGKSMMSFLAFHWARAGGDPARLTAAREALRSRFLSGAPRDELNRDYYRLLRGFRAADLEESGRLWFARERARGVFHPPVRDALRRHVRAGDLTVLVSGSFAACLAPISRALGTDLLVCTTPEVVDGVLTGEITDRPMIGAAKADAARRIMAAFLLTPRECFAYGDDASDLPLLSGVGHPVVVGADPTLLSHARREHWARLPGPRLNDALLTAA